MQPSVRKIAQLAGVSPATVSRVINNSPSVKGETLEKIRALLDTHGYSPRLARIESNTIGVVVTVQERMLNSYFVTQLIAGIVETALLQRYHIKFITYDSLKEQGMNYKSEMRLHNICGLLFLGSHLAPDFIPHINQLDIPALVVGRRFEETEQLNWIDTDHQSQIRSAVSHLFSLGHRALCCIAFSHGIPSQILRVQAFKEAMQHYGLWDDKNLVVYSKGLSEQDGFELMYDLFIAPRQSFVPTALIITNENLCIGMVSAAKKLGITIPQQVSIICTGQSNIFPHISPQISSVDIETFEIGKHAATGLIQLIEGHKSQLQTILEVQLHERASCAPVQIGV